jgi:hypothetical protein
MSSAAGALLLTVSSKPKKLLLELGRLRAEISMKISGLQQDFKFSLGTEKFPLSVLHSKPIPCHLGKWRCKPRLNALSWYTIHPRYSNFFQTRLLSFVDKCSEMFCVVELALKVMKLK